MPPVTAMSGAGLPPAAVRETIRDALTAAPNYAAIEDEDRKAIAHSLVRIAHAASLLAEDTKHEPAAAAAPAGAMAAPPAALAMNAGDEYSGRTVRQMAEATTATLKAISFPRFVNELITGVFKAILEANQQQLQQYLELIKGVSASLDGFTEVAGSDVAARRWLVEQFPQSFALEQPDPDEGFGGPPDPSDDPPEPPRLRTIGSMPSEAAMRTVFGLGPEEDVPSGGAEALVPFARRALAKSRQQMLASMVQMGMQRIVIDGGRISAGMRFHIDARSAAREDTSSQFDSRTEIGANASASWGFWSASASLKQNIGYVSTKADTTIEELNASADLTSSVELQFRTDQVPLDRLAAASTVERLRLNTLNPERELQIAAETDRARAAARAETDRATLAARPVAGPAPSATVTAAPAPPVTPRPATQTPTPTSTPTPARTPAPTAATPTSASTPTPASTPPASTPASTPPASTPASTPLASTPASTPTTASTPPASTSPASTPTPAPGGAGAQFTSGGGTPPSPTGTPPSSAGTPAPAAGGGALVSH